MPIVLHLSRSQLADRLAALWAAQRTLARQASRDGEPFVAAAAVIGEATRVAAALRARDRETRVAEIEQEIAGHLAADAPDPPSDEWHAHCVALLEAERDELQRGETWTAGVPDVDPAIPF